MNVSRKVENVGNLDIIELLQFGVNVELVSPFLDNRLVKWARKHLNDIRSPCVYFSAG